MSQEEDRPLDLKCPNTTKKMRRIGEGEIPHTSIAYSMRHFDDNDLLRAKRINYKSELEKLSAYESRLKF